MRSFYVNRLLKWVIIVCCTRDYCFLFIFWDFSNTHLAAPITRPWPVVLCFISQLGQPYNCYTTLEWHEILYIIRNIVSCLSVNMVSKHKLFLQHVLFSQVCTWCVFFPQPFIIKNVSFVLSMIQFFHRKKSQNF